MWPSLFLKRGCQSSERAWWIDAEVIDVRTNSAREHVINTYPD
jgi:hypothetical protein